MAKRRALMLALMILAAARDAPAADIDRRQIEAWLRDLADVEPDVRDAACLQLKGLPDTDVPRLYDALVAARPLRPAQAAALHDIVTYVLTRAAMLRIPTTNQAFLGIKMNNRLLPPTKSDDALPVGVPVEETMPGFVAARVFQEGDVILGFDLRSPLLWTRARPQLTDFGGGTLVWVRSAADLITFVGSLRPGTPLTVWVQRSGRTIAIALSLDGRPWDGRPSFQIATDPEQVPMLRLDVRASQAQADAEEAFVAQLGDLLRLTDEKRDVRPATVVP